MKISITRTGYNPALGPKRPANRDPTLEAHVVDIETMSDAKRELIALLGGVLPGRYRWRCSCARRGLWGRDARSARNGGARHVAAMEKR